MSRENVSAKTDGREDKKSGKGQLKYKGKKDALKKEVVLSGKISETSNVVFRATGVTVTKKMRVNYPSAVVQSTKYEVLFEGHPVIDFTRMGEAVERAKQSPPEKVVEPVAVVEEAVVPEEEIVA